MMADRTGNWNVKPPKAGKRTPMIIGTRVLRKADGRKGTIVGRVVSQRPGKLPGPVIWTIRYDDGGFEASGDTMWVRSFFRVMP